MYLCALVCVHECADVAITHVGLRDLHSYHLLSYHSVLGTLQLLFPGIPTTSLEEGILRTRKQLERFANRPKVR